MTSTSRNLRPSFWVISRTQPTVSALRPLVIALPATNGSYAGVPLKSPIRRHTSAAGASITELTNTLAITSLPVRSSAPAVSFRAASVPHDLVAMKSTTTSSTRSTPRRARCGRSPLARNLAPSRSGSTDTCGRRVARNCRGVSIHCQPVAHARFCQEIPGASRLSFELVTQVGHVDADVVGLVGVRRAPHLAKELLVRDDLSRVADKGREEVVFGRRQAHVRPADGHLAAEQVHLQLADAERGLVGLVGGPGRVPQAHTDASKELAGPEGLADVVIGAGVQRRDLVPLLAARREDDDRHGGPLAQPADDVDAVGVRQSEVDDDDVRL